MSDYRPELPDGMPDAVAALPTQRGYPVPWFVGWLDGARPVPTGQGVADFRVLRAGAAAEAIRLRVCWICGRSLLTAPAEVFLIGPMCAVNRTSAEPPAHPACADWSARACPFLARPHMVRREAGLPPAVKEAPGIMLRRNPGVTLLWASPGLDRPDRPGWRTKPDGRGGFLIDIGPALDVRWYREGRDATRAEVVESIESGLPALRGIADAQDAGGILDEMVAAAMELVPAAS